ncbi:mercury(II) reductase [Streptomyces diastaticus]|uniref:Mercuric reductase n=1 Tax=Pseudonocardia dioxanivorans (strain ATCC 55486 / DSM 44775 / JCM 13855 / CB1190) TaxID=675635 RepID=F2L6T3_PSEUX|nr:MULTISPECIES: mercury(II) reductase [Actinomycetes]AEA28805.1 mercuric reductase [Pseudonocardia dioxanivorans CB1190]OSP38780.1 mercury(II) reductase [Streptomyces sp. 13-12-16]RTL61763.1 MAG: mercury(II) reductase [Pseudonocardiaceae bacterium]GJF03554.1 mercuric reductase MerA [Pseudonocardia sp. D17]
MLQAHTGYDLAIIGSGAGAFAAAIAARNKGRSVVMVERGITGGTCVNVGCVPSKALLAAAEARHGAQAASRFPGIQATEPALDFPALIGGKDTLVGQLRAEKYTDLAAEYGWRIVHGTATFADGPVLQVALNDGGTTTIEAAHYLIATGSAPTAPPIDGLDQVDHLTSTTAMELQQLPEHLLVLGGGYVGLEQAQLFARLGSRVTLAVRSRLASWEEPEISAGIEDIFREEGITVHTRTQLRAVRRDGDGILATLTGPDGEQQVRASRLLIATGRRPVTDGLGLERVGVKTGESGEVVVDEYLRTGNPRIWAAGDVTGHPDFVYVAAAHGTLVADNALDGVERTLDYTALPKVTFTSPAIASVGMTEAQLTEAGIAHQTRTLPLENVPRALVNRDTRGLVKLIAERGSGKLLAAHVLADSAGDIITAATYAITAGMTVDQLAHTWHPYLTMAEALKLAAQTFTSDVAKLSCCAG